MGTQRQERIVIGCRRSLLKLVEYATNDSDALFEGLEDLGDVTPEQVAANDETASCNRIGK